MPLFDSHMLNKGLSLEDCFQGFLSPLTWAVEILRFSVGKYIIMINCDYCSNYLKSVSHNIRYCLELWLNNTEG